MLFCNLTPLDGRFVNAIVFYRKSDFCEYITSWHIQHSIYVRQFECLVFIMKQITSIFCNVSFAGQYICFGRCFNGGGLVCSGEVIMPFGPLSGNGHIANLQNNFA